jgi:hypothetical protein
VLLLATACGASQTNSRTPAPTVAATAAGASTCAREGLPPPAPGTRRLELSVETGPGATEVTVDGQVQVAVREGTGCAQVELTPGAHRVELRARGDDGLGVHLKLDGQHPSQPWWYDVFSFDCGQPTCERGPLAAWGRAAQADRKRLTDPCSAVQVRDVKWDSERRPGGELVTQLSLGFTVFLYKEPFDLEPRDQSCPEN